MSVSHKTDLSMTSLHLRQMIQERLHRLLRATGPDQPPQNRLICYVKTLVADLAWRCEELVSALPTFSRSQTERNTCYEGILHIFANSINSRSPVINQHSGRSRDFSVFKRCISLKPGTTNHGFQPIMPLSDLRRKALFIGFCEGFAIY